MASVEIKKLPNFKQIGKEDLQNREQALKRYLQIAVKDIIKRTQSGRDANGVNFAPYIDEYRKEKEFATGRGATVDLVGFNYKKKTSRKTQRKTPRTQPGAMLAAMQSSVRRIGNTLEGIINFINPREGDKARGNMKKRNFFNLSDTQIKNLKEIMRTIKHG